MAATDVEDSSAGAPVPSDRAVVIRTQALTKVFPGREGAALTAVDGLDLEVGEGEIFGLLGPNGAGKTTTVGMLTTRVIPTSGSATVAGVDVVAEPSLAKQAIGMVSQSNNLDRNLTVWENLYYHGRYFGMGSRGSRHAADELLDRFRLADRAGADVGALSGGMAQRLMVARSIMHRPQVLFLDEPTAGLDPQSRLALWEILGELHQLGQTILLTTHYMEEADQLSDRVAVMDHGRLLALDTPEALKRSVAADTVVRVSVDGDLTALARHLEDFDGAETVRLVDNAVAVEVKGSRGVLPRIVDHAEAGGFRLTDLSLTEPSLETVFINLTGKDLRE
ncbi:MAG: ATP-binding cassette domain-containing protein [Actinomycetota bacterium]|nr:ATP-binding cassette domain-containing protein [Actinomycetota bacterium]